MAIWVSQHELSIIVLLTLMAAALWIIWDAQEEKVYQYIEQKLMKAQSRRTAGVFPRERFSRQLRYPQPQLRRAAFFSQIFRQITAAHIPSSGFSIGLLLRGFAAPSPGAR